MMIKAISSLLGAGLALGILAGCTAAPGTAQPAATARPTATTLPAVATELLVEVLPTETPGAAIATPVPFPKTNFLKMVDDANGWASDPDAKLFRTSDGGATWNPVTTPGGVSFTAYAGAFLDANDAWLPYYDANGVPGLLRTQDGGETWTSLTNIGLGDAGGQANFEFSTPSDGLATAAGVGAGNLYLQKFESHDGGASFTVIPLVGPNPEQGLPEGTVHLCNICMDAFHYDPARLIVVEGDMATMQPRGALHLQTSTDLGQHWTEMTLPLPTGYQDALVGGLPLTFPQGLHGFMPVRLTKYNATGGTVYDVLAVYETTDGGASWSLTPSVIAGAASSETLQFVTDLDAITLCGSALCVSHDAAQTWQTVTPNVDFSNTDTRYVLQMSFVDPLTGWIIASENDAYRLYKTTDGGSTWTLLNP